MTDARPTPERLHELIDRMAGCRVAMLVDLVGDRFITGTPKRISREAPVLILSYQGETLIPGGGGNAVANVAALGGRPLPLGVVGDDEAGRELIKILAERGVDTRGILVRRGYRTPTKTRILGGARHAIRQQIVRIDVEDELELDVDEVEVLMDVLRQARSDVRVAVVSDYGYGCAPPAMLANLREVLGDDCPILGDSRYRLGELEGLDGATPNVEETEILLGHSIDDEDALVRGGWRLLDRLGARFLLITRGSSGMSLFTEQGVGQIPVHGTDQVADVTGAGDTVIGTFALALAAGALPLEAAALANFAGGVVVMKIGTATLSPAELHHAIDTDVEVLERIRWDAS